MESHPSSPWTAFLPYGLAAFLVGLVGGFASVLGPAFVQDMGLPYNNTTWTALAQATSTAACAPILGRLGDMIGRRPTLLLGISVFALGNALTALATGLVPMMAARFVVGLGSAAIAPVILAYIVTSFPPQTMARGFSVYMLISSGAVIFGPTLGGLLLQSAGWRAMMWVCTGISAVVLVLCLLYRKEDPFHRKPLSDFDGLGSLSIFLFFGLALCIPSFGQNFGWTSLPFLVVLAAAAVCLVLLGLVESRAASPILRGSFLARRNFVLPVLALFLTQGLLQANMTNLIVFVNYTQPENTMVSSYAISILYLGMSLGSVLIGPLADRKEPRTVLTGSLALTGIGCGSMLLFSLGTPAWLLMGSLGLLGLGLGGNGTIFLKVILSGLPAHEAGAGTGTYGLFRDLAAPFGVMVFVPLFTNRVTALIPQGLADGLGPTLAAATAAVDAIHLLAGAELVCALLGVLIVRFLPRLDSKA